MWFPTHYYGSTSFRLCILAFLCTDAESEKKKESKFPDRLLRLMREMFGPQNVNWSLEHDNKKIDICVDSGKAVLDPKSLVVVSSDDGLQHLISAAAKRLLNAV